MPKKILIIDSNALIHRAYHALPPFTTKKGVLVNAVYGYITTLNNAVEQVKPDYIVATFDLPKKTFRHNLYFEYKANRKKAPDDLYAQIPLVRQFLKSCDIPVYQAEGFEADDVIGSISKALNSNSEIEKYIVTGDKDTLQLVNDNTKIFTLGRGINDAVIFDEEKVIEKYKINPSQVVDYKALRGDPSDNIPGVAGVGDKTATDLILDFGTLENLYENLDKIKSKAVKKKLENDKNRAFLSQELAEIKQDMKIDFDLESCLKKDFNNNKKFRQFLVDLEFKSLLKRFFNGDNFQSQKSFKMENYKNIKNKNDWEEMFEVILKAKKIAVAFKNKKESKELEKIGLALKIGNKFEKYFLDEKWAKKMGKIFENSEILKIGYDIKSSLNYFVKKAQTNKTDFLNNFFDVQLASYLINTGAKNELEKIIFEEFGEELKHKTTKSGQASLLVDTSELEEKELLEQAIWIYKLQKEYEIKIDLISRKQLEKKAGNFKKLLNQLENPLMKILAKMEFWGMGVDRKIFEEVSQITDKKVKKLEQEIFELSGEEFNINSPSQLAKILYEKLGISTVGIKKGKTGFSTNADQLNKIKDKHLIIAKVEKYREIFKLKTTYADALPKMISDDNRIHTTFNQTITATGRLSSSEPNLQNIPRKGELAQMIRKSFVADEGKKLVAVDYSQIDLRVAAHVSSDPRMIEVFENDRDIHQATAAWVNGIELVQVTKEQRKEAKSLNFGVLYGMGTYGFMQDSGVSKERAEFFIEQYMKNFNVLKKYLEKTKEYAVEHGYVETEMGRRRYVAGINSSNFQVKNAAERIAINLPIQGLAADIMKKSMINVEKKILVNYEKEEVKMILQIHDELIFEVEEKLVDKFSVEIKEAMEQAYQLKVPLKVEVSVGENWGKL